MKRLTLEERVTRLERAAKNEFLGLNLTNKATAKDGENLLNKLIVSLKSKKHDVAGSNLSKKTNRLHITIGPSEEKLRNKLNGLGFIIAAKDGKKDNLYCTAVDNGNKKIATLSPIKLGDVKKIADFISNQIEAAKKKYGITTNNSSYKRNNGSLRKRFEAMALDGIEIGYLDVTLKALFDDSNISVNVDGRKMASEGFLTVTVSDDQGAVDYYVQAEDDNIIIVGLGATPRGGDSEELFECESLTEAAEVIHSDALMQFGL